MSMCVRICVYACACTRVYDSQLVNENVNRTLITKYKTYIDSLETEVPRPAKKKIRFVEVVEKATDSSPTSSQIKNEVKNY